MNMSSVAESTLEGPQSSPAEDPSVTLSHVTQVWKRIYASSPVYSFFFPNVNIVHATPGLLRARLVLGPNHINSKHTLHGSVSATLVDWAGGLVIASKGLDSTGLSTDLNVTYVSTAKEGEEIEIEATLLRLGRNMGFTRVEIRKLNGEVVACGNHTKYVVRDTKSEKEKK